MGIERTAPTPDGRNKARRQLVFGTIAGATMLAVAGALSPVEQAHAAVAAVAHLRDRRTRTSLTHSALNETLVTPGISQAEPITVQDTPTPDATVTALQKRILQDQAHQLENPPPGWLESNIAIILGFIGTATTIGVGLWQFNKTAHTDKQHQAEQHALDEANRLTQEQARLNDVRIENERRREDQRIDREKRDEDRFQAIVSSLGSRDIEAKIGAAIMLQTFLDPKYKESYQRFYQQIFDLTVAHLRLRIVDPDKPEPDSLHQAIIKVFKDSVPLVKDMLPEASLAKINTDDNIIRKFLDASGVRLDGANLARSDLSYIFLQNSSLIKASLFRACLVQADLAGANFTQASLFQADLHKAGLMNANLTGAYLVGANFTGAYLEEANLTRANFRGAYLEGANPEDALTLEGTMMWDVKNYSDPQKRQECKNKGAIVDPPQIPVTPNITGETK